MKWSEEELARLRRAWHIKKDDGSFRFTAAFIAKRLERSKNSVIGKAHRLRLEKRPSPIQRGVIPKDRSISRRAPKTTLPSMRGLPERVAPPTPLPVIRRPVMKAPPPRPPPERPYGRIVNCCWPISERPYRFCGDTSEPGKPYCANHCRAAYVQRQLRVLEETGD